MASLIGGCSRHVESSEEAHPLRASSNEGTAKGRHCPVAGAVHENLTLTKACSPYIQPIGGIDIIDGATLTIEAGVELRFRGNDWLEVGAGGKPGRLIAKGTPEEPIVFDIGAAGRGNGWLGVWFHSGTLEGSVLSHAIVRDAGGLNPLEKPKLPLGCITLTGVKPGALRLGDVRMERCKNGGLRMTESHVQLGGLDFFDMNEGFNVDASSVGQIMQPARFSQVARNVIRGGHVAQNATWVAQPVPYVVEGDVSVGGPNDPKLALGAGIELRFAQSRGLVVGAAEPGSIVAEGTRERPIKLTGVETGQAWSGVRLLQHTSPGTRLSFVDVSQAEGDAAVAIRTARGQAEIRDSRFSANTKDVLVGCGADPMLRDNTYASPSRVERQEPCK